MHRKSVQTLSPTDIDECGSNPCQFGGNCTDLINGYNCTCSDGYMGVLCETGLFIYSTANNVSFKSNVYVENSRGLTYVLGIEIDECTSTPCMHGGACVDLINEYNCTCLDGYMGTHCERGKYKM